MNVRWSAAEVLGKQNDLPEDVLKGFVSLFRDEDSYVRDKAIRVILNNDDNVKIIISDLNTNTFQDLYAGLVKKSIEQGLSCYMQGDRLHVESPEKRREISLPNKDSLYRAFCTQAQAMESPNVPLFER